MATQNTTEVEVYPDPDMSFPDPGFETPSASSSTSAAATPVEQFPDPDMSFPDPGMESFGDPGFDTPAQSTPKPPTPAAASSPAAADPGISVPTGQLHTDVLEELDKELDLCERTVLLNKINSALKLNPFEVMQLPYDASADTVGAVARLYRLLQVLLRPSAYPPLVFASSAHLFVHKSLRV